MCVCVFSLVVFSVTNAIFVSFVFQLSYSKGAYGDFTIFDFNVVNAWIFLRTSLFSPISYAEYFI